MDPGDITRDKLGRSRHANTAEADRALLKAAVSGRGAVPVSPAQLVELAKKGRAVKAGFDDQVVELLTSQENPRTWFVKYLRTHEQCSWRRIAELCCDLWGGDWQPPSNQLMGVALCERAAKLLEEDPSAEPWN